MEKYKIPQNCKIVGGPKLNDEVEAMLTPLELKKDNFLLELQTLIGKGLVAIEKVLSNLIEKKRGETQEGENEPDADLVGLAEAGQIICLAHNTLSKHRQFQLSGHFNDKIKKLVAAQTIDLFLFGQDFGDKWKNAKALQTTARELQAAEPSTSKNSLGQASKKRWKTSMSKGKINQTRKFSNPRNNQFKTDRDSYRKEKRKRILEETAPNVENPYPGCSDLIQMSLERKTIQERGTIEIMVAAQSQNTLKQYNSTYSKWWDFCKGNIETILQPGVNEVLSFLKQQFDRGLQHSTLNVHRSALNLICDAGKSELVDRFMKGVFKLRPNFPRYEEIWDPDSVLKYIISLHPLNKLSLEDLTVRLVVLIALCSAQRVQTLSKIKISNIKVHSEGIEIIFTDILKTSGPKKPQPVMKFPFFKDSPELCVASNIIEYIDRTKLIRGTEDLLILTIKKPHHPATSQTIRRWIRRGLDRGDIDIKYKAHSTRHAATSAAFRAGTSIECIRQAAAWSEKTQTFNKFYNKPLRSEEFFVNYIKRVG
ncbi:unnamed protein product [Callosobruchus maculatus]|uniref:Tyr recombinase domain-containing protein n=1 Tax=Callosobruchus maculatus TaxID=64391 RepID=A0A653CG12_CALMS|nr:unnamed protein product [Callosobruchus maculatus]